MQRNLTKGPITVNLLLFALPLMFGNLLQQLYNVADTWVVGRYLGADALAAVGSSYTLMTFLTSILMGLCMGSGAAISMLYGSGEKKKMRQSIFMAFCLIGAIALVVNILVYIGMDGILWILRVPASIKGLMKDYLWVIFLGILATFLYNYFANLLRAIGNSMVPLLFLAVSSILNIILDLLFVLKFHWGVQGAAGATVFSQYVSGIGICIYAYAKVKDIRITKEDMQWRKLVIDSKPVCNDKPAAIHHELWNPDGTRFSKQLRNRHHGRLRSRSKDRFLRLHASAGLRKCIFNLCSTKLRSK